MWLAGFAGGNIEPLQSGSNGRFGRKNFLRNLRYREPLNDVFLVEETLILAQGEIPEFNKIRYFVGGGKRFA